jgi:uncharacterized glyoxalase superfamily protein PhnB
MAIQIIPYLICRDIAASIDFLTRAYGFVEEERRETPSGGIHAEMVLETQRIMMGQPADSADMRPPADMPGTVATAGIFVYLEDIDGHFERASGEGAEIIHPPKNVSYGRTYAARDLDGHPWFFTRPPKLSAA